MNGTILTQSQIVTESSDKDTEKVIVELASKIVESLPELFDVIAAGEKYPIKYEQSMNTVIRQVRITFKLFYFARAHTHTHTLTHTHMRTRTVYIFFFIR